MRVAWPDGQRSRRPEFTLPVVKKCVVGGAHDLERCLVGATHQQPELCEPVVLVSRVPRPRPPELQRARGQCDEPAAGAICRVPGNELLDCIDDPEALEDTVRGLILSFRRVGSASGAAQDKSDHQRHSDHPHQSGTVETA